MEKYVRILPKKQFYRDLGRFGSVAFKNLRGGISVIKEPCISDAGISICDHLKKYYKSIDDPPHIFWMFNKKILPDKVKIKQKDSSTGDKCHYEIEGLGDKVAKKIFTENFNLIADGKICNNQIPKKLTMETILLYLHQAG